MLNKTLFRGFKWALFVLVLTWGNGRAAYLPTVGPKPIRFLPAPRPPGMRIGPGAQPVPVEGAANSSPASTPSRWNPEDMLPEEFRKYWPFMEGDASQEQPDQADVPAENSSDRIPASNARTVFPQELVPFFGPSSDGRTNRPSQPIEVEFVPPTRSQPPSSTAIYTRH